MKASTAVRDAWVRFGDRLSAGDVASFDDVVSQEANLVIGSAPGEWIEERDRMRFGFEAEGVTLTPGTPQGYEEGTLGWVVDQASFAFPDGSSFKFRGTAIFRKEDGTWRLVHLHASVGVPDEEVVALQQKWGA